MRSEHGSAGLALILALVAALLCLAWFVVRSQGPPAGPVAAVWDKTACSECRMHLGEPGFAAQLQTSGGQVHWFDDPGCLFLFRAGERPAVHAVYYHHHEQDHWLPEAEAAFLRVHPTPMGFGFGAVEAGRPGAVSLAAAEQEVLAR
jgi:hypothetical protein